MVDVTNSDYQFMAEQNKRKYLDMLTTKLFLNNEEVEGLTKGSGKMVIVVCPFCGKNRNCRYADIVKVGHTLCSGCLSFWHNKRPTFLLRFWASS